MQHTHEKTLHPLAPALFIEAILDDETESTDPKECRLPAERDEFEEFAREHQGANVAFEATRNYWFIYDCLE
jgi:hypothetical protein